VAALALVLVAGTAAYAYVNSRPDVKLARALRATLNAGGTDLTVSVVTTPGTLATMGADGSTAAKLATILGCTSFHVVAQTVKPTSPRFELGLLIDSQKLVTLATADRKAWLQLDMKRMR
jgi:hypothetical protein